MNRKQIRFFFYFFLLASSIILFTPSDLTIPARLAVSAPPFPHIPKHVDFGSVGQWIPQLADWVVSSGNHEVQNYLGSLTSIQPLRSVYASGIALDATSGSLCQVNSASTTSTCVLKHVANVTILIGVSNRTSTTTLTSVAGTGDNTWTASAVTDNIQSTAPYVRIYLQAVVVAGAATTNGDTVTVTMADANGVYWVAQAFTGTLNNATIANDFEDTVTGTTNGNQVQTAQPSSAIVAGTAGRWIIQVSAASSSVSSSGTQAWTVTKGASQTQIGETDNSCITGATRSANEMNYWASSASQTPTTAYSVAVANCNPISTTTIVTGLLPVSTVTQPITCTMDNSGTQVTLTLSGGSPSPTTVACDGGSHNITVNPSITLTATEPADGSSTRARFSGGSTTTATTTCSSGTCTPWSITNYYQLKTTYQATPSALSTWDTAAKTVTNNNAVTIDGVRLKLGNASAKFVAASSEYLSIPTSSDWYFTGDFTIDLQFNFNTPPTSGNSEDLVAQAQDGNNRWRLFVDNNAGTYDASFTSTVGGVNVIGPLSFFPLTVSANVWHHLALVRQGSNWYCFEDGTQVGSTISNSATFTNLTGSLYIGQSGLSSFFFDGWLDELRISNGIARWTSGFTPSSSPYTTDSYTVLLLHMDGSGFTDSSAVGIMGNYAGTANVNICNVAIANGGGSASCSGWIDYNRSASFDGAVGNQPANNRWQGKSPTSFSDTTGGNTHTVTYYKQLQNTYQATPNGAGGQTWDSGLSITVSGTVQGTASQTICTNSPTGGSSATVSCSGYADYNLAVSEPLAASGAGVGIAWIAEGTRTWTQTTGGNTNTANYWKEYQSVNFNFKDNGGNIVLSPVPTAYTIQASNGTSFVTPANGLWWTAGTTTATAITWEGDPSVQTPNPTVTVNATSSTFSFTIGVYKITSFTFKSTKGTGLVTSATQFKATPPNGTQLTFTALSGTWYLQIGTWTLNSCTYAAVEVAPSGPSDTFNPNAGNPSLNVNVFANSDQVSIAAKMTFTANQEFPFDSYTTGIAVVTITATNSASAWTSSQLKFTLANSTNNLYPELIINENIKPAYLLNAYNYTWSANVLTIFGQQKSQAETLDISTFGGSNIQISPSTLTITAASYNSPNMQLSVTNTGSGTTTINVQLGQPQVKLGGLSDPSGGTDWSYSTNIVTLNVPGTWVLTWSINPSGGGGCGVGCPVVTTSTTSSYQSFSIAIPTIALNQTLGTPQNAQLPASTAPLAGILLVIGAAALIIRDRKKKGIGGF